MKGAMMTRPGSWVLRYSPRRFTTPTSPCCTMLTMFFNMMSRMNRMMMAMTMPPTDRELSAIMRTPLLGLQLALSELFDSPRSR